MSDGDSCGVCGGAVQIVTRPDGATDWKHVEGAWHRPVLGTPVKDADQLWARLDEHRPTARLSERTPDRPGTPTPLLAARPVGADEEKELPRGVRTVLKAAQKNDWDARLTLAVGPWLDARGEVSRLVESLLLKASKDARRACAVWVTGSDPLDPPKFECGYILDPKTNAARPASSRELGAYLKEAS